MKRHYSNAFEPPAPMVPITARAPLGQGSRQIEGKLDTGADICALPEHIVTDLDLPPERTVRAAGFSGVLSEMVVFRVDLELGGVQFPRVEALITRRAYAIIGRNVLRKWVLILDGPKGQLELRAMRGTRRRRR
jgi:predicted aspartyl protease